MEIPPEDHEEGMCGLLMKSMYGTRDAAQNWEVTYSQLLESIGFVRGQAVPCLFHHPVRNLRIAVHGGDFTNLGLGKDLDWLREEMKKKR